VALRSIPHRDLTGRNALTANVGETVLIIRTCFVRSVQNDAGEIISNSPNCGVRVAGGRHRAYVTDFIRDARAGGCASGVPPSHLGFRLVRAQRSWISGLSAGLNRALSIAVATSLKPSVS
jgi:hypothetical protein